MGLFLNACKDVNEYRIDPAFDVYVQRFEEEAAKRNQAFHFETDGLIVEFANLKDDQAGLCHFEHPIRIEVDRTYWQKISNTAGADAMKENLIFHEMGHGILGRKHLNDVFENGDWKSMMCGGTKVNNRPWNINYRRQRRIYYIDELFNQSISAPPYTTTQLLQDTTGFVNVMTLSFDSNKKTDTGWNLGDFSTHTMLIDNKRLKCVSKYTTSSALLLTVQNQAVDFRNDFSFEFNIECQSNSASDKYGLTFGINNTTNDTIEYFKIDRQQNMFMGNSGWYGFYTQLRRNELKPSGNNKLKIIRVGASLYYFINNVYAYQTEIELQGSGTNFGFIIPARATIWLDAMKIGLKGNAKLSPQTIDVRNLKFSIKALENSDQLRAN
ncbi:MAG: hypothetical protein AUK44_02190 [Porphyromonadaceae bacterium CG2_30_38_12]|nr:MAG: hypothetical protein AUK44_02190 [Porphyromonadaceae bacterium CG2_30_38_12]